ncbi:hypothetical protein BDW75DRAFT_246081 [Aspergillus navahoensis]
MKMILAVAATELEGIRRAQHRATQEQDQIWEAGTAHYRGALRDFQYLLGKPQPFSTSQINEILAAFLLMVVYEHHFSSDAVGLVVHLRGIYTFLRSCGVTFQPCPQQVSQLPELSQQLLLIIMYLHISTIHHDRITPDIWDEAGYNVQFALVLDQLFQGSRNAHLAVWQSEYPTEEIVDDVSVFRPLELFNECNKVKARVLFRKQQSLAPADAGNLAVELARIGNVSIPLNIEKRYIGLSTAPKRFQDLIALSQRSPSGLRKRVLQTIYFAVAEYHATELLLHQRSCPRGELFCHRKSLHAAMDILRKISRDDDSKLGRAVWVMAVVGELVSEADHRRWIQEATIRTHKMGLFKCIDRWNQNRVIV